MPISRCAVMTSDDPPVETSETQRILLLCPVGRWGEQRVSPEESHDATTGAHFVVHAGLR